MIVRRALLAALVVAALAVVAPLLPAYPLTLLTQALIVGILAIRPTGLFGRA